MKKIVLFILTLCVAVNVYAQKGFPYDNEIRDFKHHDSISFPAKDGILFIGSSSIRKWTDLEKRFPGKPIIRRGVGGCELWQIVDYYTPYILFPYHPRKIFIYAGENDIAGGKSGEFVFAEFEKLFGMIRKQLPNATIYFMSVKMSPSREKTFSQVAVANKLVEDFLKNKPLTAFIDVNTPILNPATSMPDSLLFNSDYLHLNSKGYNKWQQAITPYVN
jgi:hypothetical protein